MLRVAVRPTTLEGAPGTLEKRDSCFETAEVGAIVNHRDGHNIGGDTPYPA